jgi:hypothetical protein
VQHAASFRKALQKSDNDQQDYLPPPFHIKIRRQITGNSVNNSDCVRFVIYVSGGHCYCSPWTSKDISYATAGGRPYPSTTLSTKCTHNCPGVQAFISLSMSHGFLNTSKQLSTVTAIREVATLMRGMHRRGVSAAVIPTAQLDRTFACTRNRPLLVSLSTDRPLQQVTVSSATEPSLVLSRNPAQAFFTGSCTASVSFVKVGPVTVVIKGANEPLLVISIFTDRFR